MKSLDRHFFSLLRQKILAARIVRVRTRSVVVFTSLIMFAGVIETAWSEIWGCNDGWHELGDAGSYLECEAVYRNYVSSLPIYCRVIIGEPYLRAGMYCPNSGKFTSAISYFQIQVWFWNVDGTCGDGPHIGNDARVYSVWRDRSCMDQCNIKLSNFSGMEQPGYLAESEPDKTVNNLRAEVTCNGASTAANVMLEVRAEENSGGHRHHVQRQPGSVSPASGTSPLSFSFNAPAAAGDHIITARCTDRDCGSDTGKVWVGIKGLVHIPPSGYWNLIGDTSIHPVGWYLTGEALGKLMDLARLYKQVYFPFAGPLQLNDASLERGGVFDIDWAKYDTSGNITERRTEWWTPPHREHRRGTVIDILANGTATAIPRSNFTEFEELLRRRGMTWVSEHLNQSGGHYHVRLLGVAQ